MRTHHHDPDEEESVGGQQPHDGHLVGVEVDVVLSHEGAGEDGLQSVVESEVRMTERGAWFSSDYVHLHVEDCSEELLRQQSYAIKNQLGHPKP